MSNEPDKEYMQKSIEPDATQINADDLVTGPITVTISGVRRGSKEQPIQIDLVEKDRVFRPCKSVRRILIAAYSDDPKCWVGKRMTLYRDPDIKFGGVRVGGIRISHLSGIDEPKTFLMTQSRGKRSEVTIIPLPPASDADMAYVEDAKSEIAQVTTLEGLKAIAFILQKKPKAIQDALRGAYAARQKELQAVAD